MRAADVLLSKAGGISSMKAAVVNIPLVHTLMTPGVETINAEFFADPGMFLMAGNCDEAARFADCDVFDGRTDARITEAQQAQFPKDGAEWIAEYVFGML